jgi:hypothetical protein
MTQVEHNTQEALQCGAPLRSGLLTGRSSAPPFFYRSKNDTTPIVADDSPIVQRTIESKPLKK